MPIIDSLQKTVFEKQTCYRLIPSKFPPISIFSDVANEAEFEAIYAVQALTNPRIQDEIGNLTLLAPEERVYAIPGCGYIMAAFTHTNPDGSRFSNGDYGVYYASRTLETAIAETVYHRERFLTYTKEPAQEINMRTLVADFNASLYDLLPLTNQHPVYALEDYHASQQLGAHIKERNEDGLVYHSVRSSGTNFALFKPKNLTRCIQSSHYSYVWNGSHIQTVYKKILSKENARVILQPETS